ncbi:RICIN domain-containing protein [Actinokineospora cianjurensis]|uniref:Uncharacterized protein n=1 Tax=Actinokineospora cianjurensis TaxID=585224 RepID=A0A421B0Z0_9PSEU|nr:RICIN domain-containing protein [Actinokineospora cianjurensis]RLK58027.1 hypothetical protein CLV68_4119 [Actinokineospora cianjurensis]
MPRVAANLAVTIALVATTIVSATAPAAADQYAYRYGPFELRRNANCLRTVPNLALVIAGHDGLKLKCDTSHRLLVFTETDDGRSTYIQPVGGGCLRPQAHSESIEVVTCAKADAAQRWRVTTFDDGVTMSIKSSDNRYITIVGATPASRVIELHARSETLKQSWEMTYVSYPVLPPLP